MTRSKVTTVDSSPYVQVYLGVEVHEKDGGREPEDDALAPVDVHRVVGVDAKGGHGKFNVGDVGPVHLSVKVRPRYFLLYQEQFGVFYRPLRAQKYIRVSFGQRGQFLGDWQLQQINKGALVRIVCAQWCS